MSITKIRRVKNDTYTTIANDILRDNNLSLKAKGLFVTIMGLPDNWDFSITGMAVILKEGRDAISAAIGELVEHGYCRKQELRSKIGQFSTIEYTFVERPKTENPITENPITDNPTQYKKQEVKKQKTLSETNIVEEQDNSNVFKQTLRGFQKSYAEPTTKNAAIANNIAIGKLESLSRGDFELCVRIHKTLQKEDWRKGRVDWTTVHKEFNFQTAQMPKPKEMSEDERKMREGVAASQEAFYGR